ncbi:MAG: hypothetical protein ABI369_05420, partial [Acetobacteraceae bacterium]
LIEYALEDSKVDYVGLWQICGWVDGIFEPRDPDSRKHLVLAAVQALLLSGLQPVDLAQVGAGCMPWADQTPGRVIKRISEEWDALGRDPNPGDIVWFHDPNLKPVD